MKIIDLMRAAKQQKASDIHIVPGLAPILRIGNEIDHLRVAPLDKTQIESMLGAITSEAQRQELERRLEVDFSIEFAEVGRFRGHCFHTNNGVAIVLHAIATRIMSLAEIDAPAILDHLAKLSKGLILVTGGVRSGKSTTIAAMIDYINSNFNKHIITIENPIEIIHQSKKSLVNQREVGKHTEDCASGVHASLKEDPDVIMVGEMRNLETMREVMAAAETGRLVIATMHTNSAALTIDRLLSAFPANEKESVRSILANSLEAVIAQRMLSRADQKGSVVAYEVMVANQAIRNLIREGHIAQINSIIQMNSKQGMVPMIHSVSELLKQRRITIEEARNALSDLGESIIEAKVADINFTPNTRMRTTPERKQDEDF